MKRFFTELVERARQSPEEFRRISRDECIEAVRSFAVQCREDIRERHNQGESGETIVRMLTKAADTILRGVFQFGLASSEHPEALLRRIALCAHGGYGRAQLSPHSDLDVCLLYEPPLDYAIEKFNDFLVPFLWDTGFDICYSVRTVKESLALAKKDIRVLTSFIEGRLLAGATTPFAQLRLHIRSLRPAGLADSFAALRMRERTDSLREEHRDLYDPEPNIKESAGGLRDYHTALWLFSMSYGAKTLDEIMAQGLISEEEHLEVAQALDFIWRTRNELHFRAGKEEDRLTFANQQHLARVFGYGEEGSQPVARFMQDYYNASRLLRRFLIIAARTCHGLATGDLDESNHPFLPSSTIVDDELHVGIGDEHWFAENPARLMGVVWECASRGVFLSRAAERLIADNLHLVNESFQSSDLVRRYFTAICNHPKKAGHALRLAANTGLLGRYLPEFQAIRGVIRYEDFHHYPVDEHTLRALEALAAIDQLEGPVGRCLRTALEHLSDPYILVLAILFHDFGKAGGVAHVDEGERLSHLICRRIGFSEEDAERIAFLVKHHLLMTHISQYRDLDDDDIVRAFAETMRTEERLRALFVLSYADMAAVGPNTWNEWRGTLLLELYFRAEKILLGRSLAPDEAYWESHKADEVRRLVPALSKEKVDQHLQAMGERYFVAFAPEEMASHLDCIKKVAQSGLELQWADHPETNTTSALVCTNDRPGLFSIIAGSFASQLTDINRAALFTRPDGIVLDYFTVSDAARSRPLTRQQRAGFERVMRAVLLKGQDIQLFVDRSRRGLFALLQPHIPVPTRVTFDNESSRTHTVMDIETGDRTGLLYDVTRSMTALGLDISSARIVTDARRVRDSFYVTKAGLKIEQVELQETIRRGLQEAIHADVSTTNKEMNNE